MLKKMRWNFILAATASYLVVMAVLLVSINAVNFIYTTSNEDRILDRLVYMEAGPEPPRTLSHLGTYTVWLRFPPSFPPLSGLGKNHISQLKQKLSPAQVPKACAGDSLV